jgi:hypothetical protein
MRRCSNSISLSLALAFLVAGLTQPSLAGTYCGSDATPLAKLFKETSSDWWPEVVSYMDAITIAQIIATGGTDPNAYIGVASKACMVYGQAYLGEGCWAHDACYGGKIMPGADRGQCDEMLKQMWHNACAAQYPDPDCLLKVRNPWTGDEECLLINHLQEYRPHCRVACQITTAAMAYVQSTVFAGESNEAWEAAAAERAANRILQCIEQTPPGGTCMLPAGDYPITLTIAQPVVLESAGGLVRIGVIE